MALTRMCIQVLRETDRRSHTDWMVVTGLNKQFCYLVWPVSHLSAVSANERLSYRLILPSRRPTPSSTSNGIVSSTLWQDKQPTSTVIITLKFTNIITGHHYFNCKGVFVPM